MQRHEAHPAAHACVGVSHGRGPALVPRSRERHTGGPQRVRHREVARTDHAKRVTGAEPRERGPHKVRNEHWV